VPRSPEAAEWHRIIRASVRECLETWHLQSKDGPVTVEALKAILSRSMAPILRQMEDKPPELVMALLPSLVRTMLGHGIAYLRTRDCRGPSRQEYVQLDGTVDWVSGNTLMLRVDPAAVLPVYVIVEGYVVPAAPPVTIIRVDVSGLRQSEYSFMQPGERLAVIGVFDAYRQVLVATSLIRGRAP
jgi:hypothetical protein